MIACLPKGRSSARLGTEGTGAGGPISPWCHLKELAPRLLEPSGALQKNPDTMESLGHRFPTSGGKCVSCFRHSQNPRPTLLNCSMLTT